MRGKPEHESTGLNQKSLAGNLKYDYVLLKRNGINIAHIDFDTLLAAYDCFGDSGLLNLQYLSKRLLGRTIKAHKDIVREGHTLLDVALQDVVYYACEHAEVTLQLAAILRQELARRNVEDQYRNVTLPLVKKLGDWECSGMPIDLDRLCRLRDSATDQVSGAKEAVVARVGSSFNLDSYQEVTAVLKMDKVLASVIGFRIVNARLLEELAISHELPRLLVGTTEARSGFATLSLSFSLFRMAVCVRSSVKQARTIADCRRSDRDCSISIWLTTFGRACPRGYGYSVRMRGER
jgi:DNA polymerase-1